jgi:hypothetical protein
MKRLLKTLAVIAFAAAISFSFIACDNGTTSGGSTGVAGKTYQLKDEVLGVLEEISFTGTRFTLYSFSLGRVDSSGPYTISGETISCTIDTFAPNGIIDLTGFVYKFRIISENTLFSDNLSINGISTWTKR